MPSDPAPTRSMVIRLAGPSGDVDLPLEVAAAGPTAAAAFSNATPTQGTWLLLAGEEGCYARLAVPISPAARDLLQARLGQPVHILVDGQPTERLLAALESHEEAPPTSTGPSLDLAQGRPGAPPLWLLSDGTFSTTSTDSPLGMNAATALVTAARFISGRRTSTFVRLLPASAHPPGKPMQGEGLSTAQAGRLLEQLRSALRAAAVGGAAARADAIAAAEVRSAVLTVLSHMVATVLDDPAWRPIADDAAAAIFGLIAAETAEAGGTARAALRAHAIQLLQLRGPALAPDDRARAVTLLRGMVRAAPPYATMQGTWRFAMCDGPEFHAGECKLLAHAHNFKEISTPMDAPKIPSTIASPGYRVFEAPFRSPSGTPIQIYARPASPLDENHEMSEPGFVGLLINRHAQLGTFDLLATSASVVQAGYKLMMNSQCSGLTTRFALSRAFPDADIYSSWDSTFFRTGTDGVLTASEGLDCFVAVLEGLSAGETHAQLEARIQKAQWPHDVGEVPGFVQFIGPSHPLVVARFQDLDQSGKSGLYDGFLDFRLRVIAEDVVASSTPRDPGVAASQIGGAAAAGLDWAADSLNRLAEYAEAWSALPDDASHRYAFQAGGFYSQREPPEDVPSGALTEDLGRLPSVCRYREGALPPDDGGDTSASGARALTAEVMFHSFLSHAAREYKRLLCAAEAFWRAIDVGYLPSTVNDGPLGTPLGRRGALLLMLAGLLEFPADQNGLDALWSATLTALALPPLSRSVVRGCITEDDHKSNYYYGSFRGLDQLVGVGADPGDLGKADPVAHEKLKSLDPRIGRAQPLKLP